MKTMGVVCSFFLLIPTMTMALSSKFVPLSLGPDFQSPFSDGDLLRGYKLNIMEEESPFKDHVFEADIKSIPFTKSYTESKVVTSTDELIDMLEIDGALGVSYGPLISGKGAGRYFNNKVSSKRQATIMYRTRRQAYAKQAQVETIRLSDALQNLTNDEISERFGTKFIDNVVYGAQLDVFFTITSTKDIDLKEIEAELKGKIGVGALSIEFSARFEKTEGYERSELQMSIIASATGVVDFEVPANPTFDQTNEIIKEFNTRYDKLCEDVGEGETIDEENNVLKQLSPVGFTLASTTDFIHEFNAFEAAALESKMADLRHVFYDALFWKSILQQTHDELKVDYGADPRSRVEIFQPHQQQTESHISILDDKVDECLEYRSLDLSTIVGRKDTQPAKLPEAYPSKGSFSEEVLYGLTGEGYIRNPITLCNSTFDGMHYIGFTLENNQAYQTLVPWMRGEVRLDKDNMLVARATNPEDLERLVKEYLSPKKSIQFNPETTFSKRGNRRTCAWDRCPSSIFYWNPGEGCDCQNGLNTCYLSDEDTTIEYFDDATLVKVDEETDVWKIEENGNELALGEGSDCASGASCFDDPLRGGFTVDLSDSGYAFAEGASVSVKGWSPHMRLIADGKHVDSVHAPATGGDLKIVIPEGSKVVKVSCGGWSAICSSELLVVSDLPTSDGSRRMLRGRAR